ncbi:ABC transporter permease subunit [Aeromicrobium ginsengisoli]|nr:ABC transporter permease [Aeromicrobium ginsengisoli]
MTDYLPMFVSGIADGSVVAIAAMGLVLSYKASGIFNFAHGAIGAVAAGVFYQLYHLNGLPAWLALIITLVAVGLVFGFLMERVAYFVASASATMKVVSTIGIMISLSSLFNIRYGGITKEFPSFLPQETFTFLDVNIAYEQVIVIALGLALAIGMTIFFRTTLLGRGMRAIVDDPQLVGLIGLNPTTVRRWAWVIGVTFAAIAGVFIAPNIGLDGTTLTLLVVEGFGAAAIGRFSSLPLTYLGAVLIQIGVAVTGKYSADHPSWQSVPSALPFAVLFLVLLLSPKGWLVEVGASLQQRVTTIPNQSRKIGAAKLVPMVAFIIAVPYLFQDHMLAWTKGMVFVILMLSLSLLVRLSNQVSLCQMTFAAVGAAASYHLIDHGMPWSVALLGAGLVAIPIGAFVAIPAVRLSGVYLALATLSFGLFMQTFMFEMPFMFGDNPLPLITSRPSFAESDKAYFYMIPIVGALCYGLVRLIERGRLGQLLRSKADSPIALESLGVNIALLPLVAFCAAAFLAGIAGALLGPNIGVVSKGDFHTIPTSLLLVALLVLNGRERRIGSLGASLGAAIGLVVLPEYITSYDWLQGLNLLFGVLAVEAALASTRSSKTKAVPPGEPAPIETVPGSSDPVAATPVGGSHVQ